MEVSVQQTPSPALRDRRGDALGELRVLPDETICYILELLNPSDIARLSCVSSVMYILCNEEPLWMTLCLKQVSGLLQYKGSWKKTALDKESLPEKYIELARIQVHCDGFNSLFLYRRLYRCHTTLGEFSMDNGNVERRNNLSLEVFRNEYDGKKPVMITGLADAWPARSKWTIEQFLENFGDTTFKISQKSANKISMNFKDYVSYIDIQHDEDPLYIFDEKFGEVAPSLLEDYGVPDIFEEDFFDILDKDQRPSYRWLIIGPQRSGASWHVDPSLTSAWNTLLCGRKRWALYPPGKVPFGVTVHVNEEDGDVNVETPSSLQWWLDFYPLLADEDKPIECTQLPGETIYVPSGWWHCVLNIETTIAVTQNFVNSNNFEFVCLDMAPGYLHKGVCRAGFLALDDDSFEDAKQKIFCDTENLSHSDALRKEKKARTHENEDKSDNGRAINGASKSYNLWKERFSYDIDLLAKFLDKERDHYTSPWSSGNMGPRELREWLHRLWIGKPGMRDLIWKGACMAVNVDKWSARVAEICVFHNLPHSSENEMFPVGTGSNPVYLVGDFVIKCFVEDGLECSLCGLGTELEFYSLLHDVSSTLKNHIPEIMGCGILYQENGSLNIVPWDGKGVPDVIANCNLIPAKCKNEGFAFGLCGKTIYRYKEAGTAVKGSTGPAAGSNIWPYLITKKCEGKLFAELKDKLSLEDMTNLASFLGQQLQTLHRLPYPPFNVSRFKDSIPDLHVADVNDGCSTLLYKPKDRVEWEIFVRTLNRKKNNLLSRLKNWGNPIPGRLIEKLDEYIPDDFAKLIYSEKDESSPKNEYRPCSLIHSDIMDDNIFLEASKVESSSSRNTKYICEGSDSFMNSCDVGIPKSWHPSCIIDFSDLSIGHPILDIIPIYLDIFKGNSCLLRRLLESYKLPLVTRVSNCESIDIDDKFGRLSYHAMCYCILHDENVLGAIFSIWNHLTAAESWEEVELTVWGDLNSYRGCT